MLITHFGRHRFDHTHIRIHATVRNIHVTITSFRNEITAVFDRYFLLNMCLRCFCTQREWCFILCLHSVRSGIVLRLRLPFMLVSFIGHALYIHPSVYVSVVSQISHTAIITTIGRLPLSVIQSPK